MEEVRIVASEMLKPSAENDPSFKPWIELSAYDRLMRFALYQRRILFYDPPTTNSSVRFDEVVDLLKRSLAQVLVSFYPFAGRIAIEEQGKKCIRLNCSDLSVRFSEAVTDRSLSDLKKQNFEPSAFCDELCHMDCSPKWPWSPDLPLLFAQVTKFSDGGISIGIVFSHQVSDGVSGWHFFNSWAQIARTGTIANPPVVTYSVQELEMDSDEVLELAASVGYKSKPPKEHDSPEKPADAPNNKEELVVKSFHLNQEHIAKLKSEAAKETQGTNFTTFEVLCAYFWRTTAIARLLREDQEAKFGILISARGRFGNIPKFYFGNAVGSTLACARASDLINNGIGYAAKVVHETISSYDERKNQAQLNFLNSIMESGFINELELDPSAFSLAVSSPRHPVYECDFGFGKPVGVTFGSNDLDDGKIYFFPAAEGAGVVKVTVVLRPEAMERLEVDL